MRRLVLSFVTLVVMVMPITFGTPSAAGAADDPVYVALGDSLAVGFHPGRGPTDRGYVDDVWKRLHDDVPGLLLKGFGCPGETTRAIIDRCGVRLLVRAGVAAGPGGHLHGEAPGRDRVRHDRHRRERPDRAMHELPDGGAEPRVRDRAPPRWQQRIAAIVDALRTAAGPGVPVVGMTYYDPFLGLWDLLPGGHELARKSLRAMLAFDAGLTEAYVAAGAGVADVAATFKIEDFTATDAGVPLNVADHVPVDLVLYAQVPDGRASDPRGLPQDRPHLRARDPADGGALATAFAAPGSGKPTASALPTEGVDTDGIRQHRSRVRRGLRRARQP